MEGRALLGNQRYRRLFIARTISNLGNGITPIALAFGVLDLPGTTPASLSVVLAAQAIPEVILLPLGGVVGDRLGRARVIAYGDITLSLFVAVMAVLFFTGNATVPALAALALVAGVLSALWYPAFSGLVPDVVEQEHIQPANAFLSVATNGGLILGNALGGILVAAFGPGPAIAVDALTFLVAGLLVATFRDASPPSQSQDTLLGDLRSGWQVFWRIRWAVVIVAAFSFLMMALRGAEEVMGPVLAKAEYGGAQGWATVLAAQSVGLLVGAVVATRLRVARPMLLGMLVTLTLPVWLVCLAFALPLPVVAFGAFLWGVSIEVFAVLWYTSLHLTVPRDALSRVMAYDAMGSMMFGPIGLALAGPLVVAVGLQASFLIAAVVSLAAILGALAFRAVRNQSAVPVRDAGHELQ